MRTRFFILIFWLVGAGLAAAAPEVIAVDIDSVIHPITAEIVSHALDQASREGAALVLLRLNTPGGLLDATREITQTIVASSVPVAAYVTPSGGRAASAGFFILESADVAVMAPGTNTGASSPVLLGQTMDPVMRNKIENDTSAWLRSVVTKRGRNADLAEKTVREAKAFTEREALDGRLIDFIANDQHNLLDQLNGRQITRFDGKKQTLHLAGAQVVTYRKTVRETIVSAIADPNIGFILLVLGALGIYVEFTTPGMVAPGVIGGILALLGLSSLSVLPINWVGVALLILAIACFILEAKFTSHGILAVGGSISMILGALLLINGPPDMRIHFSTALAATLPFALITTFLLSLVVRARRNKVITGESGLLDEIGVAHTSLSPAGKIFVHGEYWNAVSTTPVEAGARVRVVGVDGLKLRVEAVESHTPQRDASVS
ncbi:MAG TPA: nodulation protein NfeD [Bryobacteraceae bacterium]|nr:nodulation protein NfeD [Bryobacteraceae bacterium]